MDLDNTTAGPWCPTFTYSHIEPPLLDNHTVSGAARVIDDSKSSTKLRNSAKDMTELTATDEGGRQPGAPAFITALGRLKSKRSGLPSK